MCRLQYRTKHRRYQACLMCLCIAKIAPETNPDSQPKSEPTLELHNRDLSSCNRSSCPNTGSNSGGRWIKKNNFLCILTSVFKKYYLRDWQHETSLTLISQLQGKRVLNPSINISPVNTGSTGLEKINVTQSTNASINSMK